MKKNMVTLSKIIEGLEMVNNEIDCYYNPANGEIFLSNIGEYENINEDEDVNIIQDWYNYREKIYKEIAINWCKKNDLEYKE